MEFCWGHINDPGTDISIVRAYGLPGPPEEVMEQQVGFVAPDRGVCAGEASGPQLQRGVWAGRPAGHPEWGGEDLAGRLDLRSLQTVTTIDGEGLPGPERRGNHLPPEDEPGTGRSHRGCESLCWPEKHGMDAASARHQRVPINWFRVIPMLPHKLSSRSALLKRRVDRRLALSNAMEIDSRGNVTDHRIGTLIRVDLEMTYTRRYGGYGPGQAVMAGMRVCAMKDPHVPVFILPWRKRKAQRGPSGFVDFPKP